MVFTTTTFLFLFLPPVLAIYYLCPQRARNPVLAAASYLFYAWWSPWFVLLMLFSTLVDYQCGRLIAQPGASHRQRRFGVVGSVVVNLSLLGFFKYAGFAVANLNLAGELVGLSALPTLDVILPVGISFYTFQSMSYSIDLYRKNAEPAASLLDFMTYVSLFSQLVAGPIVRYRDFAPQLRGRRQSVAGAATGICYFAIGFAKKVLLANPLGEVADLAFGVDAPGLALSWFGVTAYALQIYFDFSGYSDMAIGLGLLFGFRLPENFNAPYRAQSITEFWRRWHISLSTWLRDYLYVPLGGNRRGPLRTYVNLAITMLLGGLWHGAQWQFVIWGGLHGAMLAAERALGKRTFYAAAPAPVRVVLTFTLVLITWVFFRAESLPAALGYLASMFGLRAAAPTVWIVEAQAFDGFHLFIFAVAVAIIWRGPRTVDLVESRGREIIHRPLRVAALVGIFCLATLELFGQAHNPFLYFQF